jgi:lipoyl(octanoyl) transferase
MKQRVYFRDLQQMEYQQAWDLQENLLQGNIEVKRKISQMNGEGGGNSSSPDGHSFSHVPAETDQTINYLLFVEHHPVYTLGKSGREQNLLIDEDELYKRGIQFFRTNRGGDITFHGNGQIVGYPILDLEKFGTDIGKYLRNLEEVIILSLREFGINGGRSAGETGVWIDPEIIGRARKICAMGVRCSRWITMHGFALNVNTDLSYFENIIPCGIQNKQVTSMNRELGREISMIDAKESIKRNFELVFDANLDSSIY